jgi:putative transposase
MKLINEAVTSGARLGRSCEMMELAPRTLQRWRERGEQCFDRRFGPKTSPRNKLSAAERKKVLEAANWPEHRDLSPKQEGEGRRKKPGFGNDR